MFTAFLYGDFEPSPDSVQDELTRVVLAAEDNRLDPGPAAKMVQGLVLQWEACMDAIEREPALFDTFEEAERAWLKQWERSYRIQRRRKGFPVQGAFHDTGWWPECMEQRAHWPVALVEWVADACAGYEADRVSAAYREYKRLAQ